MSNKNGNLEALKEYLIANGKDQTWASLADKFNLFQELDRDGKAERARGVYRRLKKQGRLDSNNLKLKSRWQSASGQWLESYKVDADSTFIEEFKEFKEDFLDDLKKIGPKIKVPQETSDGKSKFLYELAIPDFHFGKITNMSLAQQAEYFKTAIMALVKKASGVPIDRFLFPIGNDFFNSDTIGYTTTKGTPQRDNSHWQESFRVGWTAVISVIEQLKKIAPVDIVIVQGNHDEFKTFFLGDLLYAYYINDESVTIDNSFQSPRKYYYYEGVLIGYTHGDKEKVAELPLIMATEVPELWAMAKFRNFHTGHLHKQEVTEYQGTTIRVLPSLVGQDEWHKQMGYNSTKKAQAFIWGENGLEGYFQVNY